MTETAALINALATLLGAVAWPVAIFSIVALLRKQIVELLGRVENLNMGTSRSNSDRQPSPA